MLLNPPFSRQVLLFRPLIWLFNVTLAIIFLSWVIVDGVIGLLKKCRYVYLKQKNRKEMNNQSTRLNPVFFVGLVAAIFMTFSFPAKSGEDIGHVEARKLQAAGTILSLEKITEIARSIKPGEILDTELERSYKTGIYIYEIEILDPKGVVWELDINAKTGELMKIEIDD
jgi:uncharacterized membrane protein YkoI